MLIEISNHVYMHNSRTTMSLWNAQVLIWLGMKIMLPAILWGLSNIIKRSKILTIKILK
jgi:hypothetical protein